MTYEAQRTFTLRSGHSATLLRAKYPETTLWRVRVESAALYVAHAYTTAFSDHLNLGNLFIERAVHLRVLRGWPRLLGRTHLVLLRGQGLGSLLLREVQLDAVQRGLSGVTGMFTPEQASDAQKLARFYDRHGFRLDGTQLSWSARNAAP